jgi:pimeloyl-ACP methyl ester carboxylesterase
MGGQRRPQRLSQRPRRRRSAADLVAMNTGPERTYVDMVESADPDGLAELLSRPTRDEEEMLVTYFGGDRYHRMHERALRRNLRRTGQPLIGNVVVLHGIMGGALTGTDRRGRNSLIWVQASRLLGAGGGLSRLELDAEGLRETHDDVTVQASGMLKRHYGELLLSLSEDWRVRAFWFDWRKDLRLSGRALATAITGWFPAGEPVHLVAHSMGGLVARSFIADNPDLWASMWDRGPKNPGRRGGRLIMLGTPNHGSFDIPRVLAGNERMVKLLALADLRLSKERLRDVLNTFVGTYQMLPSPSAVQSAEALYRAETYAPVQVSQRHLDTAREHHVRLQTIVDPQRMVNVAGSGTRTYVGLTDNASPLHDTNYRLGLDGDGRVPQTLGLLAGDTGTVPTYFAPTSHGGLTSHRAVLDSLTDLLTTGVTDTLATTPPAVRAAASEATLREQEQSADAEAEREMLGLVRQLGIRGQSRGSLRGAAPASRDLAAESPITDRERHLEELIVDGWLSGSGDLVGTDESAVARRDAPPRISIALRRGDIGFGHEVAGEDSDVKVDAIAVGHYMGVKPQAAEEGLDKAISPHFPEGRGSGPGEAGLLTQLTLRGTIGGALGQPFFLPDPRDPTRLLAIVGMDVPGRFGVGELTVAARELCWALGRLGRRHLATVLIGAGNGNLAPTRAVEAWVTGLAQALSGQLDDARLQRVTFVEEDPRRLEDIDNALVVTRERMSAARRLDVQYTSATKELKQQWRQLAHERDVAAADRRWGSGARPEKERDPRPARLTITRDGDSFRFGAITDEAAIPEREIPLDPALVTEANDQLAAEPDATRSRRNGMYLGKLLFPADLEPTLRGSPIVLMLDSTTARVHWELVARAPITGPGTDEASDSLDTHLGIGAGVTRQLRTAFAPPPEPPPPPERRLRVLVVADPAEDAHLPGAEEEGILVADLFERFNTPEHPDRVEVVRLFGPREASRTAVLRALITDRFHVLHFAGHCFYNKDYPPGSGWIFTDGAILSARELRRIDRVPEFVFSNACESGVTPDRTGKRSADLAPTFAESFFARGVGNFVCTAWPVDDQGARLFATTLYTRLLGIDDAMAQPAAMYQAMQAARNMVANAAGGGARSWGAYQHYGDPLFRLVASEFRS